MAKVISMHPDHAILTQTAVDKVLEFVYEDLADIGCSQAAIIGALEIAKARLMMDILEDHSNN